MCVLAHKYSGCLEQNIRSWSSSRWECSSRRECVGRDASSFSCTFTSKSCASSAIQNQQHISFPFSFTRPRLTRHPFRRAVMAFGECCWLILLFHTHTSPSVRTLTCAPSRCALTASVAPRCDWFPTSKVAIATPCRDFTPLGRVHSSLNSPTGQHFQLNDYRPQCA